MLLILLMYLVLKYKKAILTIANVDGLFYKLLRN